MIRRRCQVFSGQPYNTRSRAILLHTAKLTAIAGNGFIGIQDHMANFRTGAMGTMEQIAADDDTTANAGAQSHKNHVFTACAAALPIFTQSGNIGIVASFYRESGERRQSLGNVKNTPTQIDTFIDNTLTIHGAGNTNAQTQDGFGCDIVLIQIILNRICDIRQNLCAVIFSIGVTVQANRRL